MLVLVNFLMNTSMNKVCVTLQYGSVLRSFYADANYLPEQFVQTSTTLMDTDENCNVLIDGQLNHQIKSVS